MSWTSTHRESERYQPEGESIELEEPVREFEWERLESFQERQTASPSQEYFLMPVWLEEWLLRWVE